MTSASGDNDAAREMWRVEADTSERQRGHAKLNAGMEEKEDDLYVLSPRSGRRRGEATSLRRTRPPKPVVKDWKYYRRSGAIWTDPDVHVPQSRRHLLGLRPDLDEKHAKYVRKVMRKEKRAEDRKVSRRVRFRHRTREALIRRRTENQRREEKVMNPQLRRDDSRVGSGVTLNTRTRDGVIKKDWRFYRRQGAVWTDLIHTPQNRLHLVLRPKIIEMDLKATEYIKGRYAEEKEAREMLREVRKEKAAEIREDFRRSVHARKMLERKMWGGESPSQKERRRSMSRKGAKPPRPSTAGTAFRGTPRIIELSNPKTEPLLADGKISVTPDFKGLLSVDHTIGPIVHQMSSATRGTSKPESHVAKSHQRPSTSTRTRSRVVNTSRVAVVPAADRQNTEGGRRIRPSTAPAFTRMSNNADYSTSDTGGMRTFFPDRDAYSGGSDAIDALNALEACESRVEKVERRRRLGGPENWFTSHERKPRAPRPATAGAGVGRPRSTRMNYWQFTDEKKNARAEEESLPLDDDDDERAKRAFARLVDSKGDATEMRLDCN